MRESDLKIMLNLIGLSFEDFKIFIVGKTFSMDEEPIYNHQDIKYYLSTRITIK